MLTLSAQTEYINSKTIYDSHTIRCPQPICTGTVDNQNFLVMEYLDMSGRPSKPRNRELGKKLAEMHRVESPNKKYGFEIVYNNNNNGKFILNRIIIVD